MLGTRLYLLVFTALLSVTSASTENSHQAIFRDGKVYADIDSITYKHLFELLAKASNIKTRIQIIAFFDFIADASI